MSRILVLFLAILVAACSEGDARQRREAGKAAAPAPP